MEVLRLALKSPAQACILKAGPNVPHHKATCRARQYRKLRNQTKNSPAHQPIRPRRPCRLLRKPAGVDGELLFQKHAESAKLKGITWYPTEIPPSHPPMLLIGTKEGLLATAQWNVIEYHTQNAFGTRYGEPDRMIFDVNPGEGVSWPDIQEAALLYRHLSPSASSFDDCRTTVSHCKWRQRIGNVQVRGTLIKSATNR